MLGLTKEEAIRRHRLMWNWIAQTSIQEQRCAEKYEAFKHFGWNWNRVSNGCWCCDYAEREKLETENKHSVKKCSFCPVEWPGGYCSNGWDYLFDKFTDAIFNNDYIEAAKIAYQIAELPEKR